MYIPTFIPLVELILVIFGLPFVILPCIESFVVCASNFNFSYTPSVGKLPSLVGIFMLGVINASTCGPAFAGAVNLS